jgi:hypothetical protein
MIYLQFEIIFDMGLAPSCYPFWWLTDEKNRIQKPCLLKEQLLTDFHGVNEPPFKLFSRSRKGSKIS